MDMPQGGCISNFASMTLTMDSSKQAQDTCHSFNIMSALMHACGTPRGAVGMPSRRKLPSDLLSLTNSRSPCTSATSHLGKRQ